MKNLTLIIFGISGDLACRALIPSIYTLFTQGKFSNCLLIGISQEPWSLEELDKQCKAYIHDYNHGSWNIFKQQCVLITMDATHKSAYATLHETIIIEEQKRALSGNRIFYCSTAASLFAPITENLYASHLLVYQQPSTAPWHRICYEKPFGASAQDAAELYKKITTLIHQEQLFFVDHFLAKEVIESLIIERSTNRFFQALWDNKNIESITIILHELDDIQQRGTFYDKTGALHDVVQNHILQLLALTLMDAPCSLKNSDIQQAKIMALEQIEFKKGFLGQYQNYTTEKNVPSTSTTETYAYLIFESIAPQWNGVPCIISTGKALSENKTALIITLQPSKDCSIAPEGKFYPNTVTFLISPTQELHITLNTKQSHSYTVTNTELALCKANPQKQTTIDAYATIFLAVAHDDKAAFVSIKEIILAWNIIEKITLMQLPLHIYKKGAQAPLDTKHL